MGIRHSVTSLSRGRKLAGGVTVTGLLVVICVAGIYAVQVLRVHWNRGLETSPRQFMDAWHQWNDRSFSHYRMVASYSGTYPGIGSGCHQEVEVYEDQVVNVVENTCTQTWAMTVDGIFELFQPFIGTASSRAEASDGCSYYVVDAKYDHELGYPIFIQNHLIGVEERYRYVYLQGEFACLAILPPLYTVEIEGLTPQH